MADHTTTHRVVRRAFRGADLAEVGAQARAALGEDALILSTRVLRSAAGPLVEVVAASARDVGRFERRISADPLTSVRSPVVVALVGPTGAGKTTTAVKLATHADAFGGRSVGFITLDTYRAGAVAQLETFAEVAALPLEIAYDATDAAGALARLSSYDVVIVDTPGRGPRERGEVHLVLPASLRADIAEHVRAAFDASAGDGPRLSHQLLTKLDEVPGDVGVADLAAQLGLPTRWVTDGQEIPADLVAAVPRLLTALGATAGATGLAPVPAAPPRSRAEVAR